jgi:hypothetical protein
MDEIRPVRGHEYDVPTAVTFLIAGLGLGLVLTLLFAPRFEKALSTGTRLRRDPRDAVAS